MSITCVAVLCVHNEEAHLQRALGDFIAQGIDVAVIDHGSTDATPRICAEFLGKGLVWLEQMAWTGEYDQTAQLLAKSDLVRRMDHDWVIHADADEWMHTSVPGETLLEGIIRTDEKGYNAVNFEEFVFLPPPGSVEEPRDCKQEFLNYYFFAPQENRLMRAWRRAGGFSNVSSGGHVLTGDGLRLSPEPFVLRHYIVLSQQQAIAKYSTRVFAQRDMEKGWHGNRLNLGAERLQLPDGSVLLNLPDWESTQLDRSDPKSLHFWDWPLAQRGVIVQSGPASPTYAK